MINLFSCGQEIGLLQLLQWKEIVGNLECLLDLAEKGETGNNLKISSAGRS